MSAELRPQIRILYPPISPAIIKCEYGKFPRTHATAQCPNPGYMVEILAAIMDELKYDIIPVALEPKDLGNGTHFGSVVGNKTDGFLQYILSDKVDTIAVPFHYYGSSREVFDFSTPIYNTTAGFFYKKQLHKTNNWFEFFKVYNRTVWLAMGLLLLVIVVFLHVAKCLELRQERTKRPTFNQRIRFQCQIIWYALQFLLGHAHFGKFKSGAVNLGLLILSCCYGFVILGLYSSWILSLKLDPIISTPLKDISQLAQMISAKKYHMIATQKKASDFELLKRANLSALRKITEALEKNPIKIMENDRAVRRHLVKDHSAVYVEADEKLYLDLQRQCGIEELQEHIFNLPAVLVFRKGNVLMEPINRVVRKRRDLIMKIMNRYLGLDYDEINAIPCRRDKESQILPYFGLMAMWVVMCGVGTGCLILELVVHRVGGRLSKGSLTNEELNKMESNRYFISHVQTPSINSSFTTCPSYSLTAQSSIVSSNFVEVKRNVQFPTNNLVVDQQSTLRRRRFST
ncbi:hypothetical protein M3Y95_01259600 [Aphelenchoides besseyi]|nr:hypothetical protein M3Y95_01259600 [Aphelenchoides besseyi]